MRAEAKMEQVSIFNLPLWSIKPATENELVYRPVDPNDPAVRELARDIRRRGVLEPLVITRDCFILSGHRRYQAARLAGLERVPCREVDYRKKDDPDRFMNELAAFNKQRVKSIDEILRETVISEENAAESLIQFRSEMVRESRGDNPELELGQANRRARISAGKRAFAEAVFRIIADRKKYWPLSVRAVHYGLLNDPPLRHSKKAGSCYRNDRASYQDLSNLITRLRLTGEIGWNEVTDETRPVTTWDCHNGPETFIQAEMKRFLRRYWRNLQQSQPAHIEVFCEKKTLKGVIEDVTADYTIPTTSGGGFCSVPPRREMAERFRKSGKDRLVVLMLSDFDPDGEQIALSFAKSIRDDFGVSGLSAVQVALTEEQVARFDLPPKMKVKESSSRAKGFKERHGDNVFELEALPPEILQDELRKAINGAMDLDLYNEEIARERSDAVEIEKIRTVAGDFLRGWNTRKPEE